MPKGYTTRAEVERYTLTGIEEYFRPQVEKWIASVEDYIEKSTGRVFIADQESSWRKFDVEDPRKKEIWFDECVELEELRVNNGDIPEDSYLVYPANTIPKFRIKIKKRYFPQGDQNVEIRARWGFSEEAPESIRLATTVLVAGIINYGSQEVKEKTKQAESIGPYSVTYGDERSWSDFEQVKQIIEKYRKKIPA